MATVPEAFEQAVQLHTAGQFAPAEQVYRQILAVEPRHADALHMLGAMAHQLGQHATALEYIQLAIAIDPRSPQYYSNLGEVYRALDQDDQAQACYRQSLALNPQFTDALNNLGLVLLRAGKLSEAERVLRQALQADPRFVQAICNLATVCQLSGRAHEALTLYQQAIQIQPRHAPAYNNLGRIYMDQHDFRAAEQVFRQAIAVRPEAAYMHESLGKLLRAQSRVAEARAAFQQALDLGGHDGRRIQRALLMPVISQSRDEITHLRSALGQNIQALLEQPLSVREPQDEIGVNLFYLAYQGLNDRTLMQAAARLYLHAMPQLAAVAPHCHVGKFRTDERIRVGFISKYFSAHSVTRHNTGLIARLDRVRFHVTLFHFSGTTDDMTQAAFDSADRTVTLPLRVESARDLIAQEQLDVLIYTDLGMDPFTFFLAFARLAPVQCVLPGHPVTTGIPNVDYYLSCDAFEPADAQEHYSEQLVRMHHFPSYFALPNRPAAPRPRSHFGLRDDEHVYVVGQMLFKLHCDFDEVIGRILRDDPLGRIVLFEGYQEHWTETLLERLQRTVGDELSRVVMLPTLPIDEFIELLAVVDVALDTFPFCGGTTSMQALAQGLPIVTLRGEFMRGRVTAALYDRIGLGECVARDVDDYVRQAVRLGTDNEFNRHIRHQIVERRGVLFENRGFADELGDFLARTVRQNRE